MGENERHERTMAELHRQLDGAYALKDIGALRSIHGLMSFERLRHFHRLEAMREVNPAPGFKYNHC